MKRSRVWLAIVSILVAITGVLWATGAIAWPEVDEDHAQASVDPLPAGHERVTFGSGCFWCTEAIFREVKGVDSAVSGYSGGTVRNPTYREVCGGDTGHAEVVQVTYDPNVISFKDLLEIFWKTHDPTTKNRQGADFGPQYRSAIFYHTQQQRQLAEEYKNKLNAAGAFAAPIVTEITPFKEFYSAENYHQNFYARNPKRSYCAMVIQPKLDKFHAAFQDKMK